MTHHTAYIGLGSNVGDRLANLQAALYALEPIAVSPIYETEPWGYTEQDPFLNAVAEIKTDLEPTALLQRLKDIEQQVGRRATFRYGPREIDIDILLYDDLVMDEDGLSIPHPRLHERAFMLRPLADLAPELIIPPGEQSVSELLAALDQSGIRPYTVPDTEDQA
jgi:2-amino-4-hydroxy-6-hydroxymethyldihydropteridine diphosphokinase